MATATKTSTTAPIHSPEALPGLAIAARQYRNIYNLSNKGGVVVFYNGEAQGWMSEVRDPSHWTPGCIAVSERGQFHISIGGDDYNGSTSWQPIEAPKPDNLNPPRPGQYWEGQGGFYAGTLRDGDTLRHIILADTPEITAVWGADDKLIPGEFSRYNGQHNTALILAAEPNNTAANRITTLNIDGHSDFYWGAEYENQLIAMNLPDQASKKYHWSSTQYSADVAWVQDFEDGYAYIGLKGRKRAVRAVRSILVIE
jgi:hypothetical protein